MIQSKTRQKPRTCVACRSESPKRALLRVVRKPDSSGIDTAIVDVTGKLPGRGAYICANPECLEKARKTGALARALKLKSLPEECYTDLARCIEDYANKYGSGAGVASVSQDERVRELKSLLGLSRRAGLLEIGMDAIERAVKKSPLLVLTARDCSESVTRFTLKLETAHEGEPEPKRADSNRHEHQVLQLPFPIEELSVALGAGKVQIIALPLRSGLSDKIRVLI